MRLNSITLSTSLILIIFCLCSLKSNAQNNQLTSREKNFALNFLREMELGVLNSIKNLTAEQLVFKASAEKWSAEDCIKHITASETELWNMVDASLKANPNPEKRVEIKFTDDELIKAVEDRSHKSKTFAMLEPANSPFKTITEALNSFKENRRKLMGFVKHTKIGLRDHVSVLPIGTYDAYQFILLISAHSNRHTQQIEEIKAAHNFPGK